MKTRSVIDVRLAVLMGVTMSMLASGGSAVHGQADAKGFLRVAPEEVKWTTNPKELGVQRAVIQGDQRKPGIYVVRIKFPPGVMSRPHFHKEDRHALVIQGTWYTGTGETLAPDKTVGLKPGSYMLHPAGAVHFDGAKDEEVILQLIGYGPSSTTHVKPEEGEFSRIK
jgi:quercetin dioxygenase-like cupin family protein